MVKATMPTTFTIGKNTYQVKNGQAHDEQKRLVAIWVPEIGRMVAVSKKQPRAEKTTVKQHVASFGGKDYVFVREKDPNSGDENVRIQSIYFDPDGKYEKANGKEAATVEINGKTFGLGRGPISMPTADLKEYVASLQRLL